MAQAVTQVASGKIQIGVPAYGRDWKVSTSGTCPTLAPAGVTPTQSSSFFSSLSWANGRYAYTSGGAASYIGGLFSAGTPGISFAQRPVATWDATQKESTFPYRVTFAGRTQPATVSTTAVGGVLGGTTVLVAAPAGITAGATVAGAGIAAGATVISVSGNSVTLSLPNTASVTGPVTFTSTATTPATGNIGEATITVVSPAGISAGASATGTGIAPGARVVAVVGTTVTLSLPNNAAVSGPVVFTTTTATTAVGGLAAGSTVLLASTAGVLAGGAVTGAGVGAGATVTAVSGNVVTLSTPNAGNVTGPVNVRPRRCRPPAPVPGRLVLRRVVRRRAGHARRAVPARRHRRVDDRRRGPRAVVEAAQLRTDHRADADACHDRRPGGHHLRQPHHGAVTALTAGVAAAGAPVTLFFRADLVRAAGRRSPR